MHFHHIISGTDGWAIKSAIQAFFYFFLFFGGVKESAIQVDGLFVPQNLSDQNVLFKWLRIVQDLIKFWYEGLEIQGGTETFKIDAI